MHVKVKVAGPPAPRSSEDSSSIPNKRAQPQPHQLEHYCAARVTDHRNTADRVQGTMKRKFETTEDVADGVPLTQEVVGTGRNHMFKRVAQVQVQSGNEVSGEHLTISLSFATAKC